MLVSETTLVSQDQGTYEQGRVVLVRAEGLPRRYQRRPIGGVLRSSGASRPRARPVSRVGSRVPTVHLPARMAPWGTNTVTSGAKASPGGVFDEDILMVQARLTADVRPLACSVVMVKLPHAEERLERVLR
jgi:hypothetical protein